MDRRIFLSASGVMLGAHLLRFPASAQDAADDQPEWLKKGLDRMKAERKDGVIVIVPADDESRGKLGLTLADQLEKENADLQEMMAVAVWICVSEAQAKKLCPGGGLFVLIDGNRKRVGEVKAMPDAKDWTESMKKVIAPRLPERAKAAREALTDDERKTVDSILKDFASDDVDVRQAASDRAVKLGLKISPILALAARDTSDAEVSARCRSANAAALGEKALPFGATWDSYRADPCPACGKAIIDQPARKLVRFLTK